LTGKNDLSAVRWNIHIETDKNELSRIQSPGRGNRDVDVPTRRKSRRQIRVGNAKVNVRAPGSSSRYWGVIERKNHGTTRRIGGRSHRGQSGALRNRTITEREDGVGCRASEVND